MLPAQQPAPWQQTDAPWYRPVEREAAPWEQPQRDPVSAQPDATHHAPVRQVPAAEPAAPAEEGPVGIEVSPWDAPPPFSFEEPPADDPSDAYEPLAEDFAPARPAVQARMTAPVVERPATSGGDTRNSVFGDIFTRSTPQPQPPAPASPEEPTPPPAQEPAAEHEFEAADQEFEAADEWPAEAAPSAEQGLPPARDPLEWPPVPTDFPPRDAQPAQYARQPSHDPLEWPPIPGELLRVPDGGTNGTAQPAVEEPPAAQSEWNEAAESDWSEQAGPEWSAVEVEPATAFESAESAAAPVAARPVAVEPEPAAQPELEFEAPFEPAWDESQPAPGAEPSGERVFAPPIADAAEAEWAPFEPALPDTADRAEEPVAEAEIVWAPPAYEPEYDAAEPAVQPAPISQPEPIGEQRGAVFARYAAQSIAPVDDVATDPAASAEQPAAAAQPAHAEGTRDLWFLSGQAEEAAAAAEEGAEGEPSSVQTLILTVIVALAVVALVVLFLALFTSFLR